MADALLRWFGTSLPDEVAHLVRSHFEKLEQGEYESLLQSSDAKELLGLLGDDVAATTSIESEWADMLSRRLESVLADPGKPEKAAAMFYIGYAALLAFLQSNVTGPPLPFSSAKLLLPERISSDQRSVQALRQNLLMGLGIDGVAAYKLTPNIELLILADVVMTSPVILKRFPAARWAKMRVTFMHQRLLSEVSSTLQNAIYDDLDVLENEIIGGDTGTTHEEQVKAEFLLERATIHIHHGLDKFARADLDQAKRVRRFEFSLTGRLGKRTKYQQNDISQLVVLAKSAEDDGSGLVKPIDEHKAAASGEHTTSELPSGPVKLDLNDDTLLEDIAFAPESEDAPLTDVEVLSDALKTLDPASQPQLSALDSTILLSFASSITNTSPADGLTREETLPYATRVLDGGSSNWQIYTQALLVRSRIEGYKSRTVERGLLQLQALVDQVIADTASKDNGVSQDSGHAEAAATSFLPKAKESESAQVTERLRYIFQLASPTRWDLEAQLASRWVELGGLRSALEIYERLEMWAEAALCWAATDREDKAKRVVRRQLFHATSGGPSIPEGEVAEDEEWQGQPRDPAPLDAPRLYCILGDIDQSTDMYEKGWEVSGQRYARAQRSLGRHYIQAQDYVKAAGAYSKSLRVNQLNHSSWFALGCALLELEEFEKAAEAFSRCVQLDETDAESWSNFAAAMLRLEADSNSKPESLASRSSATQVDSSDPEDLSEKPNPQKNRIDALMALKRAAKLKHDSYRIWENVLVVAASLTPPDYTAMLSAQKRIIDLRGPKNGDSCIDLEILTVMVRHIITTVDRYDPTQPGFVRMFVKFMDENVVPLITVSAGLWQLVSQLALWRNKPSMALDAEEKAWRAVTSQPGWETEDEKKWNAVVEATVRLSDSYESLGPRERTEGMGAGELVAKDWKFKARSAVRSIQGKAKSTWEDTEGWDRLKDVMDGLKN